MGSTIKVGSIVEVDRSHLAVARKLDPSMRRVAGRVETVDTDAQGWVYGVAAVGRVAGVRIAFAVPPAGARYTDGLGPRVRVIR